MRSFRVLAVVALAAALPGCGDNTTPSTAITTVPSTVPSTVPTTTTTATTAPTTTTEPPTTTTTTLPPAEVGRFEVTVSEAGPYVTGEHFPDPMVDVYRPEGDGPWPVVVWLHGGAQHRQGLDMPPAIASLGAVVVVPTWTSDITALDGHPYDFEAPAGACAVRYARAIAADHGGDPDVLIIAGHSAGGTLALSVALVGDRIDTTSCTAPGEHTRGRFIVADDAANASEYTKWGVEGEFLDLLDPSLHLSDNPDLEAVYLVHGGDSFFRTVAEYYAGAFTAAGIPAAFYGDPTTHHTAMRDPESSGGMLYLAVMQMVLAQAG